jgi:CBS domain-containing protein
VKKIRELLENKGTEVWSIAPDAKVYDALVLMDEKNIGALMVTEGGQTVGILSERDYTRNVALRGRHSKETKVSEIMEARPVCIAPDETVEEGMALMTEKRVRHLPVIEGDKVLGLVSIGDLVKAIISEQQYIIQQLEHYISQ